MTFEYGSIYTPIGVKGRLNAAISRRYNAVIPAKRGETEREPGSHFIGKNQMGSRVSLCSPGMTLIDTAGSIAHAFAVLDGG
jgi:hypothetical protein